MLTLAQARKLMPGRPKAAHKGDFGHLLLVAGSKGMGGAAILAGMGALRSGVGLLTVQVPESERRAVVTALPEALTATSENRKYTALAIGPGLTTSANAKKQVDSLLKDFRGPAVVDADALNCQAGKKSGPISLLFRGKVITPHPGELSRLLGRTTKDIEADREGAAREAALRFMCVCLLKGHRTVVSDGRKVSINSTGNPGMAKGGMGDVLTGLIGGFLAQGLSAYDAARLGAFVHGTAGDLAVKKTGQAALLPRDVSAALPEVLRRLR